MKILKERYPKGSFKGQHTDGRYMDGILYENLKIMAKNIAKDMTFMGVVSSSTLEVGTGKSTVVQQMAEAYTDLVNQYHGTNIEFKTENIVFRPKALIERAFKLPKYSCVILDEWEDAHFWSDLGVSLRQFFRKCRQLNLFIIIIIPNYFQLPMNYAISRSLFFMDVKFEGEFERGYFDFYSFNKKKDLYLKGKKTHNYGVVKADFSGRFLDGYAVPEREYRKAKHDDMIESEEREKDLTPAQIKVQMYKELRETLKELTIKDWARGFKVSERTISRWNAKDSVDIGNIPSKEADVSP